MPKEQEFIPASQLEILAVFDRNKKKIIFKCKIVKEGGAHLTQRDQTYVGLMVSWDRGSNKKLGDRSVCSLRE